MDIHSAKNKIKNSRIIHVMHDGNTDNTDSADFHGFLVFHAFLINICVFS